MNLDIITPVCQVGREFTIRMDLDRASWYPPDSLPVAYDELPNPPTHRDAIVNAFVHVHQSLHRANQRLAKRGQRTTAITPRLVEQEGQNGQSGAG